MKASFCLLVMFALILSPVSADEIYVPDNNMTTGGVNVIPFSGPWPSSNPTGEWRYQWWIPAASIGQAGYIKEIAVVCKYTGTLTAATCEYSMGHNTASAPSSNFLANLPNPTVCHAAGPYTWNATAATWSPLGLQSGFLYNGKDNLVIEVRFTNSTLSGTSSLGCYYDSSQPGNGWRIYSYGTGAYNATSGSLETKANGLRIRLTMDTTTIIGSGVTTPGGAVDLQLRSPGDPNLPYQVASSLGTGPIPVGSRQLKLSPDDLLVMSVFGYLPSVFANYSGQLDAQGEAKARINIPNIQALVGVHIHSAFVTLAAPAPFGIQSISDTFSFAITP